MNKEKNFASAIIYVHNAENRIERFLTKIITILEENFEHSEIICVNDDSDDTSLVKIKEASKIAKITSVSVLNMSYFHGLELSMNAGVDLAIGDFVFEFDNTQPDYEAKEIMRRADEAGVKLVLPQDTRVTTEFSNDTPDKIVDSDKIPDGYQGLDIGPRTFMKFANELHGAKTILWNGPLGVCEFDKYCIGTEKVAEAIAEESDAVSIVGGGDSVAAIKKLGLQDKFTHISTGGGASLELLEGKQLPGLTCLTDKEEKTIPDGNNAVKPKENSDRNGIEK